MILIKKIVYIYHDGCVKIERPAYLEAATSIQMEKLRRILINNNNCRDVNFTYEEH